MSDFIEQRSVITFCLWNEILVPESFSMLQYAFIESTMSKTSVTKEHKLDFRQNFHSYRPRYLPDLAPCDFYIWNWSLAGIKKCWHQWEGD